MNNADYESMPVVMEGIKFQRATIMPKDGSVKFLINIFEGNGNFEICENGGIVVTGRIRRPEKIEAEQLQLPPQKPKKHSELIELSPHDIYKDLHLRGYEYKGLFKGIMKMDNQAMSGQFWNFPNVIPTLNTNNK